ncbi:MAG: ABC transporter ATP-binding protein [Alphaproteobacteria bacterium]
MPQTTLRNEKTAKLLKRIVGGYARPYVPTLGLALICMLIAAAMTASIAQLMQPILDKVINGQDVGMIIPIAGAFFGTFVLRGGSSYGATVLMNKISQYIIGDIQRDLFKHFLNLDLAFFHKHPSGQLMSIIVNDVNILRATISDTLMGVGKSFLTLIFLIAVMFYQNAMLAFVAIFIFPIAAIFVAKLGKRIRKVSRGLQEDTASLSDHLSKIFQGIRVVKAYNREGFEQERAGQAIHRVRKLNIKAAQIGALSTPVNEVMVGIILFCLIVYGGYEAADGNMTAGQLGAFLTAFIMAYEPMKKLARLNNSIQLGLGAAERIFENMDTPSSIKVKKSAKDITLKNPDITFENVKFKYEGADGAALNGINFTAKNGKVTALVGPSGGGKSTVLNMIPRFYDVSGGKIKIDGKPIKDFTLQSLRGHIALVSQDITIFDCSIAENIAYGREGATDAEIIAAAKAAAAHDFIENMPEGYDTIAGEDGVKLSGGQRQRISIARAILKDAPILLLDEATSALDNESEKAVQAALQELEKGRTTIVIAHRLSTIQNADQILVLENGEIAEQGTHKQLLKNNALYAKMHKAGFQS